MNNDSLRAGRTGDPIPAGAIFSAVVQTKPASYPATPEWVPGRSRPIVYVRACACACSCVCTHNRYSQHSQIFAASQLRNFGQLVRFHIPANTTRTSLKVFFLLTYYAFSSFQVQLSLLYFLGCNNN